MSSIIFIKSYIQLKNNEKKSREKLLKLQDKKFRKIIKFAYNKSSFYKNLYESHNIYKKDLNTINIEKLPIVDKDIIMDNFNDVVTTKSIKKKNIFNFLEKNKNPNDLYLNKYHIIHSSGSSGKMGIFVYSKKEWDNFFPYITRVFNFNFKKTKSVFFGASGGHYLGSSFNAWLRVGILRYFVDSLILNISNPLNSHIKKLNEFQPNILGGYFTGLKILAEQQEHRILKICPDVIVNCGEGIIPKDKKYIEKIFGVKMTNLYGLAECAIMGVGKDEYGGIYLMDDIAILEIKKDHAFLTNLYNKTQPLIRYKINDIFKEKTDTLNKLPFTLVDDIVGRNESMLWLENRNGEMDFIHPLVLVEFCVIGLEKFQIIVKDKTSIDFLAVINDVDNKKVISKIKEEFNRILVRKKFDNINFQIKVVKDLSVDPKTGKFKMIIKNNK